MAYYSPYLPLTFDGVTGYKMLDTLRDVVKQNFRMLVLTNPGERVMDTDFGLGISALLFQNSNDDIMDDIKERLFTQVEKYIPFIQLINVDTEVRENTAYLRVEYLIPTLSLSDVLELDVRGSLD